MNIQIDEQAGTCILEIDQQREVVRLDQLRVTTAREKRTSVIELRGRYTPISEPDAEMLVAAGAEDDRFNLIADS